MKKENEFLVLLSYKVFNFTFPKTLDTYMPFAFSLFFQVMVGLDLNGLPNI